MGFPVAMHLDTWNVFMALPDPARSDGLQLLCELVDGPEAVPGASRDDFATYSILLAGRFFVAFTLTIGHRPGLPEIPDGPYVYVWEPVEWDPP